MKKIFLIFGLLFSVFSYGLDNLNNLDDAQTVSKFNSLKMVSDSKGNAYTFWIEDISISVDQSLYILKWNYKAANGAFKEDSSEIGRSDDPIRFDAALNKNNEVCVVWTQTKNYKTVTKDSYKIEGMSSFETQDAFDEDIKNFKLKAAPNNNFFLIASNDDYYGNYDAVYQWSEKTSVELAFSNFKEVMRTPQPQINDYLTDFDFTFDNQSNVLFAGLFGESAGTVLSDVYVAFKPVEEAEFSSKKVIPRLNQEYYTDHISVVYNGETGLGTTWSIFWEEATTLSSVEGGQFFLRTQVLNNNSLDTDIVFSDSPKTVYEVEDKITDQFRVYQKEGAKVLGVWVQDNTSLAYAVFDIIEDTQFDARIISESGINPVNIDVAIKSGQSLIAWNTRGQEGGDIRWGSIPSNSSTFTYQYALQSKIEGMTQYGVISQISFAPKNRVLMSWLGSNSLEEESNQLDSNAVQAVSILTTNSKKYSLTTLDQIVAKFYNLKMLKDSEQNTYVFWAERASDSFHILKWAYKALYGTFGEVQEIGTANNEIFFDVAINPQNDICIVWTKDFEAQDSFKKFRESSFTTKTAFDGNVWSFKLKSAPNDSFFMVTPNLGYRWSLREASQDSSFSELKDVLVTEGGANPGLDDFDFGFDDRSNILFTGLISDVANTVLSNVYVTFKPVEASDFNPYKVIPRVNQEYYADHISVVYNGETDFGTTWSIFWEEATTDKPQSGGVFFLRSQVLNNNSSDTDVVFSGFAKTVYEVEDKITDQFRVYQKEGTKVLGIWVQDNTDLYYTVFDIIGDVLFDAQIVSQSGINPVNIDVAVEDGLSLITWNTRGQEGGDIRWGSIPSGGSTFNYQYALQSVIPGVTEYSVTPQISLDPARQVVFSWLGNNSLEEISNTFVPQFVQAISVPFPTGNLGGRVTDAVSQQPITNVLVELILNNDVVASTKTNAQGDYIFVDIDSGYYNLRMTPIWWYPSFEQQVLIPPGETSLLDVSLKRLTINRH